MIFLSLQSSLRCLLNEIYRKLDQISAPLIIQTFFSILPTITALAEQVPDKISK